jgi:hypothetical protein
VNHYKEGKEKCNKPIKPVSNFGELLNVLKHFVFFLQHFEHLEHPGKFHKLVHSSNPGNSDNLIEILGVSENEVKWHDSQDVDEEPRLYVEDGNLLSILDEIEIFIVVGRVKDDHDIAEKHEIDNAVGEDPTSFFIFDECYPARRH